VCVGDWSCPGALVILVSLVVESYSACGVQTAHPEPRQADMAGSGARWCVRCGR